MATGAAAASADAKNSFIQQSLNEFRNDIEEDIKDGKFDVVKNGISIAHDIMSEFITTSIAATVQGQRQSSNPSDMFTMMQTIVISDMPIVMYCTIAHLHE